MNRIPSQKAVTQCTDRIEQARQLALAEWEKCNFDSQEIDRVNTDFQQPVLLLPELENMRLDDIDSFGPTSLTRRGGSQSVIATRHLIRHMVVDGILENSESVFPYAAPENHAAETAFCDYMTVIDTQWKPGWLGFHLPMSIPLILSIALFVADFIIIDVFPIETLQNQLFPRTILGILSFLLFTLWIYALSCVIGEVIRSCRQVECFITASSLQHLRWSKQLLLYNEAVKGNRGVGNMRVMIQFIWMVGFFPGAVLASMQLRRIGSVWMTPTYVLSAIILISILWSVSGKMSVLRIFFSGLYFLFWARFFMASTTRRKIVESENKA